VGAISLWSVEIIMQIRIYCLFNCSKKIALFNGILFLISIGLFLVILVEKAIHRPSTITSLVESPLVGCPIVNRGSQWELWVPATVYEFILFGFALYKAVASSSAWIKLNRRPTLMAVLIQGNILYFLVISGLLIFNNLMVVDGLGIPWLGFGPFHASLGIATSRMLIHLRKFSEKNLEGGLDSSFQGMHSIDPVRSPITFKPGLHGSTESSRDFHSLSDPEAIVAGPSSLGVT
jgi:hypothetical protein